MSSIIFTAVFLDLTAEEKDGLLGHFEWAMPDRFLDHMTIEFRPAPGAADTVLANEGNEVNLKVIGKLETEDIQVFVVEPDARLSEAGIEVANAVPHITVATSGSEVRPFHSNAALREHGFVALDEPFTLKGRLGAFHSG